MKILQRRPPADLKGPGSAFALSDVHPVVGQADILEALALLAVEPKLGGAVLIGPPGSGRRWLARAFPLWAPERTPWVSASLADGHALLDDHLDWEATLRTGRRATLPSLWRRAREGTLFLERGEDMDASLAARLGRALAEPDAPRLIISVTASQSPGPSSAPALTPLASRLAFWLPLDPLGETEGREAVLQHPMDRLFPHRGATQRKIAAWRRAIARAQRRLVHVRCDDSIVALLGHLCAESGVPGPGLDVLALRAAKARAALHRRRHVTQRDVERAVQLVLVPRGYVHPSAPTSDAPSGGGAVTGPDDAQGAGNAERAEHAERRRRNRQTAEGPGVDDREPTVDGHRKSDNHRRSPERTAGRRGAGTTPMHGQAAPSPAIQHVYHAVQEVRHHRTAAYLTRGLPHRPRAARPGSSPSTPPSTHTPRRHGGGFRPARTAMTGPARTRGTASPNPKRGPGASLALTRTIYAALPEQPFRPKTPGLAVTLRPEDLRWQERINEHSPLFIVVVDTSGSMGAARTRAAKGLIHALLRRVYVQRAQVSLIQAGGTEARMLMPPSRSDRRAQHLLDVLPTGGGTPLAGALHLSGHVAARHRRRVPTSDIAVLLITDGRANVPLRSETPQGHPLMKELATVADGLHRQSVAIAVLDRDLPGSPAHDARQLADTIGATFLAI